MLFRPILFAASAAAFLIPAEVPEVNDDVVNALPIPNDVVDAFSPDFFSKTITLPCRQCKGRDTLLQLELDIQEGGKLTLNGFELYPSADPWRNDLTATMVSESQGPRGEESLGYSLAVNPIGKDDEQDMEAIAINLRIIEVGNRFVQGVPAVDVKIVKASNGDLIIADVQTNHETEALCQSFACRLKNILRRPNRGGCSKGNGRPGHGRHGNQMDRHHRPHGARRSWCQFFKNIGTQIFLPGLTGLIAGIGVAVLATILCTSIVHLARFIRGGPRGGSWCPARRQQANKVAEVADAEEKVGLMQEENTPITEEYNEKH
jgi:hypothetical protein